MCIITFPHYRYESRDNCTFIKNSWIIKGQQNNLRGPLGEKHWHSHCQLTDKKLQWIINLLLILQNKIKSCWYQHHHTLSHGFKYNLIALWSEKMLDTVSVSLNLPRLALWPSMWPVLDNVPCALEENVYSVLLDGLLCNYQLSPSCLNCHMSFKACVLWFFCLDDLVTDVSPPLWLCYCHFSFYVY